MKDIKHVEGSRAMSRIGSVLLGVGCTIAAFQLLSWVRGTQDEKHSSAVKAESEDADLFEERNNDDTVHDDVRFLSARMHRLENQLASISESLQEMNKNGNGEDVVFEEESSRSSKTEDDAVRVAAEREFYEKTLENEQTDSGWENNLNQDIGDLFANPKYQDSGTSLASLQCGSSICKVELDYQKGASNGVEMELITTSKNIGSAWGTSEPTEFGERSIIYLAQHGSMLPPFQETEEVM